MTKLRMFLRVVSCIVIICVSAGYGQVQSTKTDCRVKGAVLDDNQFVILGLDISFSDGSETTVAKQRKDGSYEVKLVSGTYEISIIEKHNNYNYKRARLKLFCENDTKDLVVNIYPFGRRVSYGDESPEYKFEVVPLRKLAPDLDVVVGYFKRQQSSKGKVTYKNAIITHDRFTVRADSISIDVPSQTLVCIGNGWIEDGANRQRFDRLEFTIGKNGLKIK